MRPHYPLATLFVDVGLAGLSSLSPPVDIKVEERSGGPLPQWCHAEGALAWRLLDACEEPSDQDDSPAADKRLV